MLDMLAVSTPTPAHRLFTQRQLEVYMEPARLVEQRLLRIASPGCYLNYSFLTPPNQLHFLLLMDARYAHERSVETPRWEEDGVAGRIRREALPSTLAVAAGWLFIVACGCLCVPLLGISWWLLNGVWWHEIQFGVAIHAVATAGVVATGAAVTYNVVVATRESKFGWYFSGSHQMAYRA